jgi:hypothetical protein
MVSKAALLAATATVGLLAPAPVVLPADWLAADIPQPAPLLQVARGIHHQCVAPRRELRFEMLPADADAEALPVTNGPALCMAVYQPEEDGAQH